MQALVIDDSRATRAILSRILAGLGFDVDGAEDGRQGLDWLEEHGPADLVLVDWNMPVLDGLGFINAARADVRFTDMRIVMVTTEGDMEHMVAALAAGADDYAMKPFTAGVIREKLQMLGVGA